MPREEHYPSVLKSSSIDQIISLGYLNLLKRFFSLESDLGSGLGRAASEGYLEIVQFLFPYTDQPARILAFESASMAGQVEIVNYLLSKIGFPHLYFIKSPDVAKLIIPYCSQEELNLILSSASNHDYREVLIYLLTTQNFPNSQLRSTLMQAFLSGNLEICQILTDRGLKLRPHPVLLTLIPEESRLFLEDQ